MHAEEPNRDETGIPTEFVYTLKDVSSVKRLRPSMLTKMIHMAEMEKNKLQKIMTKAGTLGNGVFPSQSLGSLRGSWTRHRMSLEERRCRHRDLQLPDWLGL